MQLTSVDITHFRSINHLKLRGLSQVSLVCGPNGAGKSNVLRAIRFALRETFSEDRMRGNVSNHLTSANAQTKVSLTFSNPTLALRKTFKLQRGAELTYTVSVKKNGNARSYLNGEEIFSEGREKFTRCFRVINVPAIRDIESDGLESFREILAQDLLRTRGRDSYNNRVDRLKSFIEARGNRLLSTAHTQVTQGGSIDRFLVDADGIDFTSSLKFAQIHALVSGAAISADKIATGHQSALVIESFIRLAEGAEEFVFFFFEEPDNHLHPTSMRSMANQLNRCTEVKDAHLFLTTHSPHLINQFDLSGVVALRNDLNEGGTSQLKPSEQLDKRAVRVVLTRAGLLPSEALLCRRVVLVEGPLDAQIVNKMVELEYSETTDSLDILVVPAGGKAGIVDLSSLLRGLGVDVISIYDWDSLEDARAPYFSTEIDSNAIAECEQAIDVLLASAFEPRGSRKLKHVKTLEAMKDQLPDVPVYNPEFRGSIVDRHLKECAATEAGMAQELSQKVAGHQIARVRGLLDPIGIWVWKATPEEVLVRSNAAAQAFEDLLIEKGYLERRPPKAQQFERLRGFVKGLAHEPMIFDQLFDDAWDAGLLNNTDFRKLARKVAEGLL